MSIQSFINALKQTPKHDTVFNPWYDVDPDNDLSDQSPKIRKAQLKAYLTERLGKAKILILGEALGYQGGHFTGMAMTSERILLGHMLHKGIEPTHVFQNTIPRRTSKESVREKGFTEPTATIAWGHLLDLGLDPQSFVIWNAFPWHPYKKDKGMLSNRTPKDIEMEEGIRLLNKLITLFDFETVIAVGNKAKMLCDTHDIQSHVVRHPANGGATKFRNQVAEII